MNRPLRIVVADDEPEMCDYLEEALARLGHEVCGRAATGHELVSQVQALVPDLVMADVMMPDMDGIQAALEFNRLRQVPVILISAHHDSDLLSRAGADPIMGYLVKPVKEADLKAAISVAMLRFQHFLALSKEAADLRQALEDRKIIERAKGIVMKRLRIEEEDAFRRLRKLASDKNWKLVEAARTLNAAEDLFRELGRG